MQVKLRQVALIPNARQSEIEIRESGLARTGRRVIGWTMFTVLACAACEARAWQPTPANAESLAERLATTKAELFAKAPGYSEGPTWRDGEVFFCSGLLWRVDAQGSVHRYLEIGPAGSVLRDDGHLLICDNKYKALLDVAPDGRVGVVVDAFESRPLQSLNDLTIDARGNVYWSDPEGSSLENRVGRIFRVRPDGRVDRMATGLAFPNGLDVDPASQYLYVIESQTKKILRYPLPADDELLGQPEEFHDVGGSGADGCAFDAQGNLWVADFHRPETGQGRITVLSPDAQVLGYLPIEAKVVSNVAFGGPNHDEIFCTTGEPDGVFHANVGVAGFAGHPGKPLPITRELDVVAIRNHPDAETLQKIARLALEAGLRDGKFDAAARGEVQSLVAGIGDERVRDPMRDLLPELEQAAARHAQDAALLAEIERLHGKATLEVAAPDWLRSITGDEALAVFGRIVEIDLNERTDGHKEPEPKALADRVTDDWLAILGEQTDLRRLELSGTAVTSEGLVHLRGLTNLERLNLCLTAVDDAGLAHLAAMVKMRRMTVCSSRITGAGFAKLGGMQQLESINLHSSPATDEGLEAIGKLTSLRRLEIVHTAVTDAGLRHLETLVNLRQLHVASPGATEAALPFLANLRELYELDVYEHAASNPTLAQIARLPKLRFLRLYVGEFDDAGAALLANLNTLEELALDSSNITDACLEKLAGLTRLRKIHLSGARVTEEGRRRARELWPRAEVTP